MQAVNVSRGGVKLLSSVWRAFVNDVSGFMSGLWIRMKVFVAQVGRRGVKSETATVLVELHS